MGAPLLVSVAEDLVTCFGTPVELVRVGDADQLLDWETFEGIRTYHFEEAHERHNQEDRCELVVDHLMVAVLHYVAYLLEKPVAFSYLNLMFHIRPSEAFRVVSNDAAFVESWIHQLSVHSSYGVVESVERNLKFVHSHEPILVGLMEVGLGHVGTVIGHDLGASLVEESVTSCGVD